MSKERFYIRLENQWFSKDEKENLFNKYGDYGLLIYSILMRDLTIRNTFKFSITELLHILRIKNTHTRMINKIKLILKLFNENQFTLYTDSKCENKLDLDNIDNKITYYGLLMKEPLKNNFFILYDDEIDKIINLEVKYKINKGSLISQFSYYAKSFGGDNTQDNFCICYPKIETIASNINSSDITVKRFNKILIDNNLLIIGNAGMNKKENKYENTSNTYARLENKEFLDKFLKIQQKFVNIKNIKKEDKLMQDKQRKLKQIINKYKKEHDIDDLSKEEWKELNQLELNYYDFVTNIRKKKVKRGVNFTTIKMNGTNKEYWNQVEYEKENEKNSYDVVIEDLNNIIKNKKLNNIEKENNLSQAEIEANNIFGSGYNYKDIQW